LRIQLAKTLDVNCIGAIAAINMRYNKEVKRTEPSYVKLLEDSNEAALPGTQSHSEKRF
jgi:hypothetical protein